MAIPETAKNMTDTLTQETNGNFGGAHMWEVIHDADDIKLPVINKPPLVALLDVDEARKARNPFRVQPGIKITEFLEDEMNLNKREREKQLKLSVQEKTTYSRRTKQLPKVERDTKLPPVNAPRQRNIDENGLRSKRQPLSEHIQNMRHRRLILYSGHIMKEEMKKLDELIEAEEKKLNSAEEDMRASLNKLDDSRMEMDQKHIEARQMSRQLVTECHKQRVKINRITSHKMSLELDISDAKEKLTDYKMYHDILKKLSVQREEGCEKTDDVEETHGKFGSDKSETKATAFADVVKLSSRISKNLLQRRKSAKSVKFKGTSQKLIRINRSFSQPSDDTDLDDEDFDADRDLGPLTSVEVYFDSPESVMELITELYYQNITRILKFRQIEDELKETQLALVEAGKRKEAMLVKLTEHIKERSEDLKRKKNKLNDIKIKVLIHSGGTNTIADKEAHWENLQKRVNDVYISLLGKSKVRISTEQKLTNIENRLFELLHQLEAASPEIVEGLWEAKSKEKKQSIKELCYKDLRERRKELIKKSWKNVLLASKRGPTRKLMFRSKASVKKKNKNKDPVKILSYDDDLAYYFSV